MKTGKITSLNHEISAAPQFPGLKVKDHPLFTVLVYVLLGLRACLRAALWRSKA